MSAPTFTPGPWVTGEDEIVTTVDGVHVAKVYTADDFPCVEEADEEKVNAEATANAHLIASAPALYVALKELSGLVGTNRLVLGEYAGPLYVERVERAAHAALARAEGR